MVAANTTLPTGDSASRRHEQGGHFLQEDKGRELAGVVVDFVNRG
ncbi:MAG: hypothetical protein U5N53_26660 [Mycobacterium sp.]|nr:hypothetical protein [Mycobacterium sp.]